MICTKNGSVRASEKKAKNKKRINFPLDRTLNGLNGFLTKIRPYFDLLNLNCVIVRFLFLGLFFEIIWEEREREKNCAIAIDVQSGNGETAKNPN